MRPPARLILATLCLAGCAPFGTNAPPAGPNAATPDTGKLLASMSVEEKVGQLMVIAFSTPNFSEEARTMVKDYHVGGVILFQQNLQDAAQVRRLTGDLQHAARIPLLIGVDQEGGPVVRVTQGVTIFPSQMASGASFDPSVAAEAAGTTARELHSLGINTNFAPDVDVNSNPRNPVIGVRSYGGDPALVTRLATAAIHATQEAGVLAVAKHFPGHGDTDVDSHLALPIINRNLGQLQATEFPPFQAAIGAGVDAIMTAHVLLPALEPDPKRPATLSTSVLGYLRSTLGFNGVIITDDLEMGAIVDQYGTADAAKLAFEAGADLMLFRRTVSEQKRARDLLLEAVKSGEISQDRLNSSVRRILEAKAKRGLLTPLPATPSAPAAPPKGAANQQLGTPPAAGSDQAVAQDVATRGVTLVQNARGTLPLKLDGSAGLCVVFPKPSDVDTQEIAASAASGEPGSLGQAVQQRYAAAQLVPVGLRPSADDVQAAMACGRRAAVVVLGSYNLFEHPQETALLKTLATLGKPAVVVALRLPYDLAELSDAEALLAIYSHRPASLKAAADAIFGAGAPPAGHLPVAVHPRWGLGFGLLDWSRPDTVSP